MEGIGIGMVYYFVGEEGQVGNLEMYLAKVLLTLKLLA